MKPRIIALGVMLLASCAGKTPTYATLTALAKETDNARQRLAPQCDANEAAAISKAATEADAHASMGVIHKRCEAGLAGIEATAKTLQTARDEAVATTGHAIPDALVWAAGAVDAYRNLRALLATLNVQLPAVPGGS